MVIRLVAAVLWGFLAPFPALYLAQRYPPSGGVALALVFVWLFVFSVLVAPEPRREARR